jgi:hypothetical protein
VYVEAVHMIAFLLVCCFAVMHDIITGLLYQTNFQTTCRNANGS